LKNLHCSLSALVVRPRMKLSKRVPNRFSSPLPTGAVSRWVILDGLKFPGVDKEVEELRQRLALPILLNPPQLHSHAVPAGPTSSAAVQMNTASSTAAMQMFSQMQLQTSGGASADRTTNRPSLPSIRMPSPSPSPPSSTASTPRGSSLNAPIPSGAYQRGQSMRENASPPVVFPENRQKGSSLGRRVRTAEEIAKYVTSLMSWNYYSLHFAWCSTDALLKSARQGDAETVKRLIFQTGINPNVRVRILVT